MSLSSLPSDYFPFWPSTASESSADTLHDSSASRLTPIKSSPIVVEGGASGAVNTVDDAMLRCEGRWFKDTRGRVCLLRGVNVSGSCKLPYEPRITSHTRDGFLDHRRVSFAGRPFPLDEADEHFQRLRSWGFLFLRFQITWEAIEHAGPGIYDQAYLEYLVKILYKAKAYGFRCFLDPHQDVWSRFTGGSGAPGWTLELVGFDLSKLTETGAAIVHNTYPDPENYPRMIWPTNYTKLATATMFTLFFAGNAFAPRCMVDISGSEAKMITLNEDEFADLESDARQLVNIQDFLQQHYFSSIEAVVKRLAQEEQLLDTVVVGYDTLNEPSGGFLGFENISALSKHVELKNGAMPTPLQAMLLGEGIECDVEIWKFSWRGPTRAGSQRLNASGVRCWRDGYQCPWLSHKVYDKYAKKAIRPDYFSVHPKTKQSFDWIALSWKPFVRTFTDVVRKHHPNAIVFVEPPVNEPPPRWDPIAEGDPKNRICYAFHWYDGPTLLNKRFSSWWTIDYVGYKRGRYSSILGALSFGLSGIKKNFTSQLALIRQEGLDIIGDTPGLLGEFGIPFDLDQKRSYKTNDYSSQLTALDANMTAVDRNILNSTLWNYCSDNNHKWGDNWNGEDLSLWSQDDVQPHARKQLEAFHELTYTSASKSNRDIAHAELSPKIYQYSKPLLPTALLNEGARALAAFLRPYPLFTAGIPLNFSFDYGTNQKRFLFSFLSTLRVERRQGSGSEIFVPRFHYGVPSELLLLAGAADAPGKKTVNYVDQVTPLCFAVKISDGSWTYDPDRQIIHYFHEKQATGSTHTIEIAVVDTLEFGNQLEIRTSRGGSVAKNRRRFCRIL